MRKIEATEQDGRIVVRVDGQLVGDLPLPKPRREIKPGDLVRIEWSSIPQTVYLCVNTPCGLILTKVGGMEYASSISCNRCTPEEYKNKLHGARVVTHAGLAQGL